MKKFIFILLCIFSFNCYSQTNYSIHSVGVSINSDYSFKENNIGGAFSTYLQNNFLLKDNIYWRLSFNLICTFPDFEPNIRVGIGAESLILSNFYIFGEMFPSIKIAGTGHQVYGDHLALYLPLNIGLIYKLNFSKEQTLSFELSTEKELTIYSTIREQIKDDIYLRFKLRYSYNFFVDRL